MIQNYKL